MKLLATAVTLSFLSFGAVAAGLDTNNDGKISSKELAVCDINGDKIITKDEAKKCGMTDAQWKQFDKDQSGQIEAIEIANAG
jgi:Ca2+-binding EF-hand superfamily protein